MCRVAMSYTFLFIYLKLSKHTRKTSGVGMGWVMGCQNTPSAEV